MGSSSNSTFSHDPAAFQSRSRRHPTHHEKSNNTSFDVNISLQTTNSASALMRMQYHTHPTQQQPALLRSRPPLPRSGRAAEYSTWAPTTVAAAATHLPARTSSPQERSLGTTTTTTAAGLSAPKFRTTTTAMAPPRPNFVSGNEYMLSIFDYNHDIDGEISNINFD